MGPCLGSSPFLRPKARTFIPGTLVTCHIPALPEVLLCVQDSPRTQAVTTVHSDWMVQHGST